MRTHAFGRLAPVSILTLGGGGLGQLWGPTTREECVATVRAAVDAGITMLDLAPRYGDGKAEQVVGEAFGGRLPPGVRVTSKCNLGNPPPERIERILRQSIEASLRLTQLDRLDLFFLHSNIVPRGNAMWRRVDTTRFVPLEVFQDTIRPLFEKFVAEGLIGAWGVTGIGHPDAIVTVLGQDPKPAAVQVIANLLELARRAEVLRRSGETARDHGGGACERRRRDGYPRGAGRRADRRDRPADAGGSPGNAGLRPRRRFPRAVRRPG